MCVGQSLCLGLNLDLLNSVQGDLSQFADSGLVQFDLSQVVLLDPRDGVVLSVGQGSAKNEKFEDLIKKKLNLKNLLYIVEIVVDIEEDRDHSLSLRGTELDALLLNQTGADEPDFLGLIHG